MGEEQTASTKQKFGAEPLAQIVGVHKFQTKATVSLGHESKGILTDSNQILLRYITVSFDSV